MAHRSSNKGKQADRWNLIHTNNWGEEYAKRHNTRRRSHFRRWAVHLTCAPIHFFSSQKYSGESITGWLWSPSLFHLLRLKGSCVKYSRPNQQFQSCWGLVSTPLLRHEFWHLQSGCRGFRSSIYYETVKNWSFNHGILTERQKARPVTSNAISPPPPSYLISSRFEVKGLNRSEAIGLTQHMLTRRVVPHHISYLMACSSSNVSDKALTKYFPLSPKPNPGYISSTGGQSCSIAT